MTASFKHSLKVFVITNCLEELIPSGENNSSKHRNDFVCLLCTLNTKRPFLYGSILAAF